MYASANFMHQTDSHYQPKGLVTMTKCVWKLENPYVYYVCEWVVTVAMAAHIGVWHAYLVTRNCSVSWRDTR